LDQAACNAQAIRRGADEEWFQRWVRETLGSSPTPSARTVQSWEGEVQTMRRGLEAIDRLKILLAHANLSNSAKEYASARIGEVDAALRLFNCGPQA